MNERGLFMNADILSEYKKDLEIIHQLNSQSAAIRHKYNNFSLETLTDLLPILMQSDISIYEVDVDMYGFVLKLNCAYFNFHIINTYKLENPNNNVILDEDKWYIMFDCGGQGRLNFDSGDSNFIYKPQCEEIWQDFLERIKSYKPLNWDKLNQEYIFTLEDGYRLYKDFESIYRIFKNKIKEAICKHKIQEFENELDILRAEL